MLNGHQFPPLSHRTHPTNAEIPTWATPSTATNSTPDHTSLLDNEYIFYGGDVSSVPAPIFPGMPVPEGAEAANNMSLASAGAAQFSRVTHCQIPDFRLEQLSMVDR